MANRNLKWWKDYFSFSKKERVAMLVLLLLFALLTWWPEKKHAVEKQLLLAVADTANGLNNAFVGQPKGNAGEAEQNYGEENAAGNTVVEASSGTRLFPFDPNTIGANEWLELGVPQRTVQTIQKYLAKGGRFRSPADIHKIYGLHPGIAGRLEPYIHIQVSAPSYKKRDDAISGVYQQKPVREPVPVPVNTADSAAWEALPGIGATLSRRIIRFRERLGGFFSVEQVAETYGLPDSVFQQIRPLLQPEPGAIHKININTAVAATMKLHPYLSWSLANAIEQYRSQHGAYQKLEDLQQIHLITPDIYQKISPYLTIN